MLLNRMQTRGFNPTTLFSGGQPGWFYDIADTGNMWQDSAGTTPAAVNSPVGKVNDKSGNGNHLIQATAAARPILRQSGSLYYLEFDGVDDILGTVAAVNLTGVAQLGMSLAFTPNNSTPNVIKEFGPGSLPGGFYNACSDSVAGNLSMECYTDNYNVVLSSAATFGSGVTSVFTCQNMDATQALAANMIPLRRNGVALASTVFTDVGVAGLAFGNMTFYLGGRSPAGPFASAKIYGEICRGGAFSATEVANVDAYHMQRSGL